MSGANVLGNNFKTKWTKFAEGGRWPPTQRESGAKWSQVEPSGAKWGQVGPSGAKWGQVSKKAPPKTRAAHTKPVAHNMKSVLGPSLQSRLELQLVCIGASHALIGAPCSFSAKRQQDNPREFRTPPDSCERLAQVGHTCPLPSQQRGSD